MINLFLFSYYTSFLGCNIYHTILARSAWHSETKIMIIAVMQNPSYTEQYVFSVFCKNWFILILHISVFAVAGWDPRLLPQYSYSPCWLQDGPSDGRLHADGAVQSETNTHHSWAGTAASCFLALLFLSIDLAYFKAITAFWTTLPFKCLG